VELFRPLCVFEEDRSWFKQSATDDYLEVNALVREKCPDIIINNTTSGIPGITIEQRLACVEHARPEMASLDIHAFILRIIIKGVNLGSPVCPLMSAFPGLMANRRNMLRR
jgi:hypothetical protein